MEVTLWTVKMLGGPHDSADLRKRSSSFDILRKLLLVHLNVDARLTRCIYVIAIYICP